MKMHVQLSYCLVLYLLPAFFCFKLMADTDPATKSSNLTATQLSVRIDSMSRAWQKLDRELEEVQSRLSFFNKVKGRHADLFYLGKNLEENLPQPTANARFEALFSAIEQFKTVEADPKSSERVKTEAMSRIISATENLQFGYMIEEMEDLSPYFFLSELERLRDIFLEEQAGVDVKWLDKEIANIKSPSDSLDAISSELYIDCNILADILYAEEIKPLVTDLIPIEACKEALPQVKQKQSQYRSSALKIKEAIANVEEILNKLQQDAKSAVANLEVEIRKNEEATAKLETQINDSAVQLVQAKEGLIISDSAKSVIAYTLIGWGAIIGIVVIAIIALKWIDHRHNSIAGTFSYALFLEMVTVFLLTGAILILGIAGKLNQEGLAALIGGISGYVLGRLKGGDDKATNVPGHSPSGEPIGDKP